MTLHAPTILPDGALDQHEAIVGKTGSGKTHTAKTQVERLLDLGRRVCIIDPTGAWWGLRSSADGKKPGYSVVVFGGEHADIQINEHSAGALAEAVAGGHLNCIIDLSDFLMGQKRRFVTEFAQTLHRRNRVPLHLIIDEADEFAPQRPLPETRRMLHEIDRLVRRGRIKGFRIMFITQRPAVLHKDILTQANTLIAMRLTAPQDRGAIEAWIKGQADPEQGKEIIASLPKLKLGEGWIWSPEYDVLEKVKFPAIKTFDSSKAPDHDDGDGAPVELAHVDLDALKEQMAAAVDEAAQNDPTALKARVAELERQLATKAPDDAALDKAHVAGRTEAATAYGVGLGNIIRLAGDLKDGLAAGLDLTEVEPEKLDCFDAEQHEIEEIEERLGYSDREVVRQPAPKTRQAPRTGPTGMTSAASRMLSILVQHHPARFTWGQIATLAGLKARGGHFNHSRKALRDHGFIDENGSLVWVSEKGIAETGEVPAPPRTVDEKIAVWRDVLPTLSGQILDILVGRYPSWIFKSAVAAELSKQPRGGHWNNGISILRNNGLIEESGQEIRADECLFTVPGRARA